jgi:hypothetical protein
MIPGPRSTALILGLRFLCSLCHAQYSQKGDIDEQAEFFDEGGTENDDGIPIQAGESFFRADRYRPEEAEIYPELRAQRFTCRKRVNQSTLLDVADGNELVRPVGHSQQPGAIGEGRNVMSRIEPGF